MLLRKFDVKYTFACLKRDNNAQKAQTKRNKKKKVFTSAVFGPFRKMALAFVPAAVLHARFPYYTPVWYGPPYARMLISPALNC